MAQIELADLYERVTYEPVEGVLRWKGSGTQCGQSGSVTLGGKLYATGKLAWFYQMGRWPSRHFHFVDGDKRNIRLDNLRNGPRTAAAATTPVANPRGTIRITRTRDGSLVASMNELGRTTKLGTYADKTALLGVLELIL